MTIRNKQATQVITKRYCSVMICQIPAEYFQRRHFVSWINSGNGLPVNCYLWKLEEIAGVTVDIQHSSKGYYEAETVKTTNSISFALRFDKNVKEGICIDFMIKLFKKDGEVIQEIGSTGLFIQLLSAKAKESKRLVMYLEQDWITYSPMPPALPSDEDDDSSYNNSVSEPKKRKIGEMEASELIPEVESLPAELINSPDFAFEELDWTSFLDQQISDC